MRNFIILAPLLLLFALNLFGATYSTTVTQKIGTQHQISSVTLRKGELALSRDTGVLFAQMTSGGNEARVRYYPGKIAITGVPSVVSNVGKILGAAGGGPVWNYAALYMAGAAPIAVTGTTVGTISIAAATPLAAGSMSAADKTKLDGLSVGSILPVQTGNGGKYLGTDGTTASWSPVSATDSSKLPLTGGTITVSGFGYTPTDGLALVNSTAATVGSQQYSPTLRLTGNGWATSGATSQPVDWKLSTQPVPGVAPSSYLRFDSVINGGAPNLAMYLSSTGVLTAGSGVNSMGPVTGNAASGAKLALMPSANSVTAIQMQNAAGASILNVDSTNGRVGVGTAAPSTTLDVSGTITATGAAAAPGLLLSGANPASYTEVRLKNTNQSTFGGFSLHGSTFSGGDGGASAVALYNDAGGVTVRSGGGDFNITTGAYPGTNRMTLLSSTGNVGIGTTSPAYPLDVTGTVSATSFLGGGASITGGTLANGASVLTTTATLSTAAADQFGVKTTIDSGTTSANNQRFGSFLSYQGAYTGNSFNIASYVGNTATGTGTSTANGVGGGMNYGLYNQCAGATAGDNVGLIGIGQNSTGRNFGVVGLTNTAPGTVNTGVAGVATAGTYKIGVYARISAPANITTPLESAALIADNGSSSSPIAVFKANSATALTIDSSGKVGIGTTTPTAQLDISGNTIRLRTSQSPASGATCAGGEIAWDTGYIYICTAANTWKRAALTGGY